MEVGRLAGIFGRPLGAEALCQLMGITHDAGKLADEVQRALRRRALDHGGRLGVKHKLEGAALGGLLLEAGNIPAAKVMALANFGHHDRIPDWPGSDLKDLLVFMGKHPGYLDELVALIEAETGTHLRELAARVELPVWVQSESQLELFTRMCHSTLVDADFLDTEAHFRMLAEPRQTSLHGIETLRATFEATYKCRYTPAVGEEQTELSRLRWHYFNEARRIGQEERPVRGGIYRLPAPTGCGKTMAAAAFALAHAERFVKRRVVVAVPFTSITTQNAEEYRRMFGDLGDEVVLEHHSNIIDDAVADNEWRRFAASNWDAEFIVTTTVQLLESLFANRPSATRKLHRLVNSVVVIDEVQSLPVDLLPAVLRMLKELSAHCGVTFLLASATQPAFWDFDEWREIPMVDLAPVSEVPAITRRVDYEVRSSEQTWEEIADEVSDARQALVIVNTTNDAQRMHALLAQAAPAGQQILHLSARMYNAHRARVLKKVKALLIAEEPVVLVSTQVIEAGVDIDFPMVYRALAPADSIVQSAGRCNREGKLAHRGRVVVFQPTDGGIPSGVYASATEATRSLFIDQAERARVRGEAAAEFGEPASMEDYYRLLYSQRHGGAARTRGTEINGYRDHLAFERTHERFKLIEDASASVVVDDGTDSSGRLTRLLDRLQGDDYILSRSDRRLLTSFTASVPARSLRRQPGLFKKLAAGPIQSTGDYDERVGLVLGQPAEVTIW